MNGWRVELARAAERAMRKMPPVALSAMRQALRELAADPWSADIKKLKGYRPPQWRLRVGEWRAAFEMDSGTRTITVLRVFPRQEGY